jgi:hypothetical protein
MVNGQAEGSEKTECGGVVEKGAVDFRATKQDDVVAERPVEKFLK